MNEELQSALAEIIDSVIAGKDFILEQAPDVIHQLLAWKLAESLVHCILSMAALVLAYVSVKVAIRGWSNMCAESGSEVRAILGSMSAIGFIMTGLLLLNITWLQIWIAPKVYLLEYASQLIK